MREKEMERENKSGKRQKRRQKSTSTEDPFSQAKHDRALRRPSPKPLDRMGLG
jgi:hypothetical protein